MRKYVKTRDIREHLGLSRNKLNQLIHNRYLLETGIVVRLPLENGNLGHARVDYEGLCEYMRVNNLLYQYING